MSQQQAFVNAAVCMISLLLVAALLCLAGAIEIGVKMDGDTMSRVPGYALSGCGVLVMGVALIIAYSVGPLRQRPLPPGAAAEPLLLPS